MTGPCPGARAVTGRPSWRVPPGATDRHCHVFGPFDRYPLSPGRSYTPPEASVAAYLDMLGTIGLSRTVIVQPSIYGTENAVTLDAVEAIGLHRARAVVVVDESAGAAELEAMAARGARGVRFNAVSGNGVPMDQLERLVERIAPLGWHVQLYAHAADDRAGAGAAPPAGAAGGGPHGRREGRRGRGGESRLPGAPPAAGRRRLGQALRLPLVVRPPLRRRRADGRALLSAAPERASGAPTGRIPRSATRRRCPTTANCWTPSAPGQGTTMRLGGRCWWTTRRALRLRRRVTESSSRHGGCDDANLAARPIPRRFLPLVQAGGLGSARHRRPRSRHTLAAFAFFGPSRPGSHEKTPGGAASPPRTRAMHHDRSDYDFDVISGPTIRVPPARSAAPGIVAPARPARHRPRPRIPLARRRRAKRRKGPTALARCRPTREGTRTMILLIDNYDSFTFNLYHFSRPRGGGGGAAERRDLLPGRPGHASRGHRAVARPLHAE